MVTALAIPLVLECAHASDRGSNCGWECGSDCGWAPMYLRHCSSSSDCMSASAGGGDAGGGDAGSGGGEDGGGEDGVCERGGV